METFDFTDYLLHYDVVYNTNNIFAKDCFKNSDGTAVPIVKIGDGHDCYELEKQFGQAVIENRDDGVVAKCTFINNYMGEAAKEVLSNKEYGISVYANRIQYDKSHYPISINKVLSANVKAVILVPSERMHRIKEICDDKCRSSYSE